ncbi:endo alpha-1,4 polygalactosaminidase [Streptomyces pactum]|uniref:Alpha-1,4-polygalactosaminidase n=1 Tax=Streptomyces pactum TaxID=68249 RepID=A0A7T1XZG9_9ACTN|nr:endo alpha-1,4 polygalactosaminidase [Streptomyces pactum]MBH5333912.1 endo alpha-1,4 polygalactosaminidase [Streptomyces pactum]QPP46755.1 alpha-1,4-polygalactosaminidase [Streptomyces pactum]
MFDPLPPTLRRGLAAVVLLGALAAPATGCGAGGRGSDGAAVSTAPSQGSGTPAGGGPARGPSGPDERPAVVPPAPHTGFDYQIGGAYPPAPGVRAVSRDRTAEPTAGLYNICYVNAFQAQPDATGWWQRHHPDLLLRDDTGAPVMDRDWDEALLDISTPAKRERLATVVGEWIDGCAAAGYQAVEADNLDSHERSGGRLTPGHDLAFAELLVARAHAAGLAIGQKNAAELAEEGRDIGFDFAVAEECGRYDECADYAAAFDGRVFVIEYEAKGFAAACEGWGGTLSVVLRDLEVRPAGEPGHLRRTC